MRLSRYLVMLLAIPMLLSAARTHETNPMSSAEDLQEGERLYRINCGVCHGMEGNTGRGARLARRTYLRGNSDAELFDLIEAGIPGTDMPGLWLDEDAIWKILLFVRTFAATASAACEPGSGDAVAGKQVFDDTGSCLACHTVGQKGGRLGPDMTYAGVTFSPDQIRKALVDPASDIAKRYGTVRIVTGEGEQVEGIWINENAYNIFVMDSSEEIHSFRKAELKSLEQPDESLMPAYGNLLSNEDIENLIAYLCTLQGPTRENVL